jgi:hypothetical protein
LKDNLGLKVPAVYMCNTPRESGKDYTWEAAHSIELRIINTPPQRDRQWRHTAFNYVHPILRNKRSKPPGTGKRQHSSSNPATWSWNSVSPWACHLKEQKTWTCQSLPPDTTIPLRGLSKKVFLPRPILKALKGSSSRTNISLQRRDYSGP